MVVDHTQVVVGMDVVPENLVIEVDMGHRARKKTRLERN